MTGLEREIARDELALAAEEWSEAFEKYQRTEAEHDRLAMQTKLEVLLSLRKLISL